MSGHLTSAMDSAFFFSGLRPVRSAPSLRVQEKARDYTDFHRKHFEKGEKFRPEAPEHMDKCKCHMKNREPLPLDRVEISISSVWVWVFEPSSETLWK